MPYKTPDEIKKILQESDGFLYQQNPIKARGYFLTCCEYLWNYRIDREKSEIIDKNIKKITRKSSYIPDPQRRKKEGKTNRGEEWFVKDLFPPDRDKDEVHKVFGKLIEYQIPIRNTENDVAGGIDFISVIDNFLYLHEIKYDYNKESILKAILQIQTYYQQIEDTKKLIKDFGLTGIKGIRKSVVIFKGSVAHRQINKPKVKHEVKKLLELFGIELFLLERTGNEISRTPWEE